ncbi:hypothetical protein GCM10011584_34400 [Nocardioides phosphati]|uniref:DUF222 domain-containing protein n=1 Tax=Nocardioides phosphati TaxID=1867775 RepID=A0ABQ2NG01_9ACTN|nr:hypothetical protein [Nocardioides phosphati]GGO94112.1 hypothetical protein GCM10011584_34400 [Nocardioides phosphati]
MNAAELIAEVQNSLANIFERMGWAEDEIARAQKRHPDAADRIYHSFSLLAPRAEQGDRMGTEMIYRAHAREILDRVAAGEDTRPGTSVELVIGLLEVATRAPLNHEGFGLCARMWAAAGLPDLGGMTDTLGHYEAISASRIDDGERKARHAARDDSRTLGAIECEGMHHGDTVACTYADQTTAA